jgi:hypothetical protein
MYIQRESFRILVKNKENENGDFTITKTDKVIIWNI